MDRPGLRWWAKSARRGMRSRSLLVIDVHPQDSRFRRCERKNAKWTVDLFSLFSSRSSLVFKPRDGRVPGSFNFCLSPARNEPSIDRQNSPFLPMATEKHTVPSGPIRSLNFPSSNLSEPTSRVLTRSLSKRAAPPRGTHSRTHKNTSKKNGCRPGFSRLRRPRRPRGPRHPRLLQGPRHEGRGQGGCGAC